MSHSQQCHQCRPLSKQWPFSPGVYAPHTPHINCTVYRVKKHKAKNKRERERIRAAQNFRSCHWPLDARAHTNKCYWWCLAEVDTYQTSAAHDFSLLHKTSKEKKVKVHGHGHIIRNRHILFYTKNETNEWARKKFIRFWPFYYNTWQTNIDSNNVKSKIHLRNDLGLVKIEKNTSNNTHCFAVVDFFLLLSSCEERWQSNTTFE